MVKRFKAMHKKPGNLVLSICTLLLVCILVLSGCSKDTSTDIKAPQDVNSLSIGNDSNTGVAQVKEAEKDKDKGQDNTVSSVDSGKKATVQDSKNSTVIPSVQVPTPKLSEVTKSTNSSSDCLK